MKAMAAKKRCNGSIHPIRRKKKSHMWDFLALLIGHLLFCPMSEVAGVAAQIGKIGKSIRHVEFKLYIV